VSWTDAEQMVKSEIYEKNVYFQGTTSNEVERARLHGLDPREKTRTSVDGAILEGVLHFASPDEYEHFRETAMSHFYFTRIKDSPGHMDAKAYAKLAAYEGSDPKILRAFLPSGTVKLEPDPDSKKEAAAFRTKGKIDREFILRSKKDPAAVSLASESFKEQFNNHLSRPERKIDSHEAAEMLRDEQSDSEDDFKEPDTDSESISARKIPTVTSSSDRTNLFD
jgi:hypothetical protein